MKKNMNKAVVLIALLFVAINTNAQTEEDYNMIIQRAKEKVKQLNDYISYMADPQKTLKTKSYYKKQALQLFIHDGEAYTEIIEYQNGNKEKIQREGVTMEVASLSNRKPRTRLMKTYFDGLMNMKYTSVSIQSTDIADMRVSKLQPYGNGQYICSVYFDQAFIGKRREGGSYKDITRKWVVCYVQIDETIDGPEYMIRLGDVHVESISKMD